MGELSPLALRRPDPHFPHPRLPQGGLPPHYPHPKVDPLQKILGLTLTLAFPPNSLPFFLLRPTKRPRTPPWRLYYVDTGWVHPWPLVQPRVIFGMHVCVDGNM